MPTATIQPYVTFSGRCEEAVEFYKKALGAEVEILMYFKDSPDPVPPGMLQPGFENKVMHTTLKIGGATLMASDGCDDKAKIGGITLSLALPTEADVDRAFAALSDGGQVSMPPSKTFWSRRFGMLTDRFGVSWMVTVIPDAPSK